MLCCLRLAAAAAVVTAFSFPGELCAQGGFAPPPIPGQGAPSYPVTPPGQPPVGQVPGRPLQPAPPMEVLAGTDQIIAQVGPEVVLLSEVLPDVNRKLEQVKDQIPPGQIDDIRRTWVQQRLQQIVETKLVIVDVQRTVPKEAYPQIREQLAKSFETDQIKRMMTKLKVGSRAELLVKIAESGLDIDQLRETYIDNVLAVQWTQQQTRDKKEFTARELEEYYEAHSKEYEFAAKARWEQITVKPGPQRSKAAAYRRLAEAGNLVANGAPFADVARQYSDDSSAERGGVNDWVSKDSLASKQLDQALFSQPVGVLSPSIIEDEFGFHIIRVLERRAAGRTPFVEVQNEIRKKLLDEHRKKKLEEYVQRVARQTKVWTVFDDSPPTVSQQPGTPPLR